LPRRLLYSELQEGRRSRGGQMKRFSDNVKLLLKKCQIPPGQLEALAADRLVWRDVCKEWSCHILYQLRSGGRSSPASSPHHLLAADSRPTLPHLWPNLCLRFRTAQSSTHPQSSILNSLAQRHRRPRRTPTSKQASKQTYKLSS